MKALALLCMTLVPAAAAAQAIPEDPMEVQRCIWACQANTPGADSAEYHACVAERCNGTPAGDPALPAPAWTQGAGDTPGWSYAAVTDPDTGIGLQVICGPGGQRSLWLTGAEGPDATLTLMVGGSPVPRRFLDRGGAAEADPPPDAAEIAALAASAELAVYNEAGHPLLGLRMNGAAAALAAACP